MSTIDVSAEIDITASPADIAGVMFDPNREPEWMKAVAGVELIDPALERGARVIADEQAAGGLEGELGAAALEGEVGGLAGAQGEAAVGAQRDDDEQAGAGREGRGRRRGPEAGGLG